MWYNVVILTERSGYSRCGASLRLKWLEEIPATYDFMADVTLSIFVDESGRFQFPDAASPYYIVSLVLHDQRKPIDGLIAELERHFSEMRLSNVCFHAGPLIRQKNAFAILDWSFRVKIFRRMLAFAHKLDFKYHCLVVEKRFVDSKEQLIERLERDLTAFFDNLSVTHPEFNHIKVYYDCGQTPVTNILLSAIKSRAGQKSGWQEERGSGILSASEKE